MPEISGRTLLSACVTTRRRSRRASPKCCATARRFMWRRQVERGWLRVTTGLQRSAFNPQPTPTMAGHSKCGKVKHFKGAIDAKRGKIFSKLGREITIAAKIGGGDPDLNPRLRMVLLKCRMASMPRDNIERAIKKGTGGGEVTNFEDLTYEIYGPGGVALLVEASTDNRNRTASEIRSLVTKGGGSIATAGSVSRLFQRKGQIIVSNENANEDKLMELALEAGAEDFKADENGYEI